MSLSRVQTICCTLGDLLKERNLSAYVVPSGDPHLSEYEPDAFKRRAWISEFTGSAGCGMPVSDKSAPMTDLFNSSCYHSRQSSVVDRWSLLDPSLKAALWGLDTDEVGFACYSQNQCIWFCSYSGDIPRNGCMIISTRVLLLESTVVWSIIALERRWWTNWTRSLSRWRWRARIWLTRSGRTVLVWDMWLLWMFRDSRDRDRIVAKWSSGQECLREILNGMNEALPADLCQ